MKVRTCLTVVFAVALLIGTMAPFVSAACEQAGQVVYTSTFNDGGGVISFIFMKDGVTDYNPQYYVYFKTRDATFANLCNMALMSRHPIKIHGDAASCPTSGDLREGGNITKVRMW